jgi:riboflavin kinase/FMN adenylyltransferase
MQVLNSIHGIDPAPSVVTVGNFDGVHRGHRMILASVIDRARALGIRSAAVTFDPHPAHVLFPDRHLPLITPLTHKLALLAETGIDLVVVLPFAELRLWSATRFAEDVLRNGLYAVEVYEGETFRFGYGAQASLADLTEIGYALNFSVHACQPLIARGAPVSSSRIRSLIAAGNVSEARALLGRPFSIVSTPASGRGYGTLYTVPTINLAPYAELVPANGVYITTLKVGEGEGSRTFRGVTNTGNRPTFGADSFAIETHLFNFEPLSLTESTPLELTFLHRLRDEQRFDSPESLRAQISRDIANANRFFSLCNVLKTIAES